MPFAGHILHPREGIHGVLVHLWRELQHVAQLLGLDAELVEIFGFEPGPVLQLHGQGLGRGHVLRELIGLGLAQAAGVGLEPAAKRFAAVFQEAAKSPCVLVAHARHLFSQPQQAVAAILIDPLATESTLAIITSISRTLPAALRMGFMRVSIRWAR